MDLEGGYDCCHVHLHKSPTQILRSIARRNAEARTKDNRYKEEKKSHKDSIVLMHCCLLRMGICWSLMLYTSSECQSSMENFGIVSSSQ